MNVHIIYVPFLKKKVNTKRKIYKDVLIRRREYRMTELDKIFIEEVKKGLKELK